MPGMPCPDGMMTWWMGGWGWLWMLVPVLVVALLVWLLVRNSRQDQATGGVGRPDPLRTLEERFARGEIDQEEFERRRSALRDEPR